MHNEAFIENIIKDFKQLGIKLTETGKIESNYVLPLVAEYDEYISSDSLNPFTLFKSFIYYEEEKENNKLKKIIYRLLSFMLSILGIVRLVIIFSIIYLIFLLLQGESSKQILTFYLLYLIFELAIRRLIVEHNLLRHVYDLKNNIEGIKSKLKNELYLSFINKNYANIEFIRQLNYQLNNFLKDEFEVINFVYIQSIK